MSGRRSSSRRVTVDSSSSSHNNNMTVHHAAQHFPFKLYDMLEYVSDSEHSTIVSWSKDGASFAIHDKISFMNDVVPDFFNQTKFRSFTRQLNLWGFTREEEGWYHENFIRGEVDNLKFIERIEIKSASTKATASSANKKKATRPKKRTTVTRKLGLGPKSSRRRESTTSRPPVSVRAPSPAESSVSTMSSAASSTHDTVITPIPPSVGHTITIPENVSASFKMPPIRSPVWPAPVHNSSTAVSSSSYCHQPQLCQQVGGNHAQQAQPYSYPTGIQSNIMDGYHQQMPLPRRPVMNQYCQYTTHQQQQQPSVPPPPQQDTTTTTTNEDLLFLLSDVFEPQSSNDDNNDLSSILSLNDVSEDFMNPLSFVF